MRRRPWLIGSVGLVLVVAASFAFARSRDGCGTTVRSRTAAESSTPFLDAAQRREQPDPERDTLVRTLEAATPPVGEVLGAVGYHYEQWAQVSAYSQGIGVRTRDNPDFTMLDDRTLRPRWSVEVSTPRSAYDADDDRYLVAPFPEDGPAELVALDAATGERAWCAEVGGTAVGSEDPFATAVLPGGDVAVLAPATDGEERIVRVGGRDGSPGWERTLDAGAGDFLGDLGEGTLLAGGRTQFALFDAEDVAARPAGVALVLLSARDGSTQWSMRQPAGADVHVLGTDPATGTAVVVEWIPSRGTTRLIAIDRAGNQEWFAVPTRSAYFDATLRAGRVLVRAGDVWSAYALDSGSRLWQRTVPAEPQFLPYGFELDSVPLLDDDHVLVGGTTALHTLDLRNGRLDSLPLPTDGINTTYWPYQVAVSPGLVALATNTGAVVFRRE